MSKPYYLIDFENVQPKALDRLHPSTARIKVFLGQHQSKLTVDLVQALQPFGADAEYIQIQGNGPDAVDFHIAYYIGRVSALEPGVAFNIVSNDRGFDPLVRHLGEKGIECRRLAEIPGGQAATVATPAAGDALVPAPVPVPTPGPTPARAPPVAPPAVHAKAAAKPTTVTVEPTVAAPPAPAKASPPHARAAEVIALLQKSTKPAQVSGLKASIKSWLMTTDPTVEAIVQSLEHSRAITITGTRVAYALGPKVAVKKAAVKKTPAKQVTAKKAATKNVTVTVDPPAISSPSPKAKPLTTAAHAAEVVALLRKYTTNKPAKLATLKSSIQSWLKTDDAKAVNAIVQSLTDSRKITVTGTKVAYALD